MVKTIILLSDGTIECFDNDDCKVAHYTGQWTEVAHMIASNYKTCLDRPSAISSDELRIMNPTIWFKIANTNSRIQIPAKHFFKIVNQISTVINFE